MYNNNGNFSDMLNAISVILGMQNLIENREQSEHNNIQTANTEQAKYILTEIAKQFEEQNKILSEHAKLLHQILEHLKETQDEKTDAKVEHRTAE